MGCQWGAPLGRVRVRAAVSHGVAMGCQWGAPLGRSIKALSERAGRSSLGCPLAHRRCISLTSPWQRHGNAIDEKSSPEGAIQSPTPIVDFLSMVVFSNGQVLLRHDLVVSQHH